MEKLTKKYSGLWILLLLGLFFAATALSAPPSGKIKMELTGKKGVMFPHEDHVNREKNCQLCHHSAESGQEQKCTNCHTVTGKDGAKAGQATFHTFCKGCHEKHKPKAPVVCKGCHNIIK